MARRTILDAVVQVLENAKNPVTAREIHEGIVTASLYEFRAKDPVGVVRGAIAKHLREDGPRRVEQVGRDRFKRV